MAKLVHIVAVVDDDWSLEDLNYEANDALVKHDVVMYVESVQVVTENYDTGYEDEPVQEDPINVI